MKCVSVSDVSPCQLIIYGFFAPFVRVFYGVRVYTRICGAATCISVVTFDTRTLICLNLFFEYELMSFLLLRRDRFPCALLCSNIIFSMMNSFRIMINLILIKFIY